jgi:ribosome modulation factor
MSDHRPPIVHLPGSLQEIISLDEAFNQGYAARMLGRTKAANPYAESTEAWLWFNRGFDDETRKKPIKHHIIKTTEGWRVIMVISGTPDCDVFAFAEDRYHVRLIDAVQRAAFLDDQLVASLLPS